MTCPENPNNLERAIDISHLGPYARAQHRPSDQDSYRALSMSVTQVQGASWPEALKELRRSADDAHPSVVVDNCRSARPLTLRELAELTASGIRGLNVIQTDLQKLPYCKWPTSSGFIASPTNRKFKVCPDAFQVFGTKKTYRGSYDDFPGRELDFETYYKKGRFGLEVVDIALEGNTRLRDDLFAWLGDSPLDLRVGLTFQLMDENERKSGTAAYLEFSTPLQPGKFTYRLIQLRST